MVRTRVFPDPAPARTKSGPWTCSTASRCAGLSVASSSRSEISIMSPVQPAVLGAGSWCPAPSAPAAERHHAHLPPPGARAPNQFPPAALRRNPRFEQRATQLLRDSRTIIDDPNDTHVILGADPQDNRTWPPLQRINCILHQ